VARDRVVELVAADRDRLRHDDPAQRDHRDFGGTAADVDDHVAERLLDRHVRADSRGERLLDEVHLPRAGGQRRLGDGALLDLGDPRRRAHDHAGARHAPLLDLADEVAQHLLRDLEVGYHPVS
jgi:hypothetical protein